MRSSSGAGVRIRKGDIEIVLDRSRVIERFDAVVVVLFFSHRLLLVRNEDRAWEFPGGHREGDETFVMTAAREVLEETGMRAEGIEYLGYYLAPGDHLTVIACADVPAGDLGMDGPETVGIGLFEDLPAELSFSDGREQLFLEVARAFRSAGAMKGKA